MAGELLTLAYSLSRCGEEKPKSKYETGETGLPPVDPVDTVYATPLCSDAGSLYSTVTVSTESFDSSVVDNIFGYFLPGTSMAVANIGYSSAAVTTAIAPDASKLVFAASDDDSCHGAVEEFPIPSTDPMEVSTTSVAVVRVPTGRGAHCTNFAEAVFDAVRHEVPVPSDSTEFRDQFACLLEASGIEFTATEIRVPVSASPTE